MSARQTRTVRKCDCRSCRDRDARRFAAIVGANYGPDDLASLRAMIGDDGTTFNDIRALLAQLKRETEWTGEDGA